jgi:hypothetical protein
VAKTVYDVLISKLKEDTTSYSQFLVDGAAKDHAEYREIVGLLRGLKLAMQTIEDLKRAQTKEDEDD